MSAPKYDTERLKQLDIAHHLHPRTNLKRHAQSGPLVMAKGDGVYIWDTDGNRYIDAAAGLWNINVGHGRKELAEVAKQQIEEIAYGPTFFGLATPPPIELAAKLAQMYPGPINHFQFTSGGAESNETAIKIARYYWALKGKPEKVTILSRMMGYHGIAMGALSATGIPAYWQNFGPRPPGFVHLMAPHKYRNADDPDDEEGFVDKLIAELEETIAREGADTIAAMIGEPVQGAGGVVPPPESYWRRVKQVLEANDILYIADEVITGFGRTGSWWGSETFGIEPDILTCAKQLTSAYLPMSAVLVSDPIYQVLADRSAKNGVFGTGYTYSGHPVPAAVALEALTIYREMDLPARARALAPAFGAAMQSLADHPLVGEARSVGLIGAVELTPDKAARGTFAPGLGVGARVVANAQAAGLITRALPGDILALCPPMIITEDEIREMVSRLRQALDATAGELG